MAEMYKCKKCGKEIDSRETVCPFCGEETDNVVRFTYLPDNEKKRARKGFEIVIIIVIVLMSILVLFLFRQTGPPERPESDMDTSVGSTAAMTEVPNFMGNTEQRAYEKAQKAELIADIEYESNDRYDEGKVFYQDIDEMTKVEKQTHIKLKIAVKNPVDVFVQDNTVIVPQLEGLTIAQAAKELDARKLKYEVIYFGSDKTEDGCVISQNYKSGAIVTPEKKIYISVCKKDERTPESIVIETPPKQTSYYIDDNNINFDGMQVSVNYTDGSQDIVSTNSIENASGTEETISFEDCSPDMIFVDNLSHIAGKQTLTVHYKNKTTTFDVEIAGRKVPKNISLASIKIVSFPEVMSYSMRLPADNEGKDAVYTDLKGLKVKACLSDGTEKDLVPYVSVGSGKKGGKDYSWQTDNCCLVSNIDLFKEGKQTVKINYYGKSASFDVTVGKKSSGIFLTDSYPDGKTVSLDYDGALEVKGTGVISDGFWNSYKKSIKKIVINSGIESIESTAFADCTNVAEITLPPDLKTIAAGAFKNWTNQQKIFAADRESIPDGWEGLTDTKANIIFNP